MNKIEYGKDVYDMSLPFNGIKDTASKVYHQVFNVAHPQTEDDILMSSLKSAQTEWQRAESLFDEATDPDLVDHAVYRMMASKTRYNYLIKSAKNK